MSANTVSYPMMLNIPEYGIVCMLCNMLFQEGDPYSKVLDSAEMVYITCVYCARKENVSELIDAIP